MKNKVPISIASIGGIIIVIGYAILFSIVMGLEVSSFTKIQSEPKGKMMCKKKVADQEYSRLTTPFPIKTIDRADILLIFEGNKEMLKKLDHISDETMLKIAGKMEEKEDYTDYWNHLVDIVKQEKEKR